MLIPRQEQALTEIHRVLRPGGRLAALVWSAPERNSLFTLYMDIVRKSETAQKPDPSQSDSFSLADLVYYTRVLTEAGFHEVQVQTIEITFQFRSFEELIT